MMINREILLDCALELFSRYGYDAVGVSAIVEAAGLTKPTLYHYFGSKRGLLEALLARESGRLIDEVQRAAMYEGDLVLTLEKITRAYFRVAESHEQYYRLQLGMYFSAPKSETNQAVRPYKHREINLLEEVFIQAVKEHGNMSGRHGRYAAGFLGTINAMIGLYLNAELALTDELVFQMVHQFMHGIFS